MTRAAEPESARELLTLCLPTGQPARASTLAAPADATTPDWDALIRLAIEQGVAPLLAVRTRHLRLPVAARERLESIYSSNSIRNLRLAAEESRICAALGAAGLRHWPLKGPGLSERLYGDIGVRQVADLDVLVEPEGLARADALLAGLGYARQTTGPIENLRRAQELIYVRDCSFPTSPGTRQRPLATAFYLDLHQRLLPYVRRDPLAASVIASGMTRENLLLYLCANQITHRFARLRYLCDVAAFVTREGDRVEWDLFLTLARRMPWGPGIGFALDWAGQYAPDAVPAHVLHALRPNPLGDLLLRRSLGAGAADAASRTRLLDGPGGASVSLGAAYLGRPAAARIAWQMMFPSRAYLREQTGAAEGQPLAGAYAARLLRKIPGALRQFLRPAR
ncbi:MAG TPA: nucleotidyltransferase family protein [Patescibacteria group bacterium]|nr:nucleotidyltransferase family protein [Patescibacteria group bacterium]